MRGSGSQTRISPWSSPPNAARPVSRAGFSRYRGRVSAARREFRWYRGFLIALSYARGDFVILYKYVFKGEFDMEYKKTLNISKSGVRMRGGLPIR